MNALFLIPGEVGGTETYLRETLRALGGVGADRVTLFCSRESAGTFAGDGGRVDVVRCPVAARSRPRRLLYEQARLPGLVAAADVDVLWSPGYTAPFRIPCASVVTVHDLQFRHHPEDFSPVGRVAQRLLVGLSCRRAERVLTASEASARDLVELAGVPRERLTVTPFGVAPDFFTPLAAERAETLLREAGVAPPFVLTVASSYPHKNLARLVEAFAALDDGRPRRLVIVGGAHRGEAALRRACRRLDDPGRVVRRHGLSRETLRALYRSADVFVLPTLFEGFGLPVLEAMAAGAPVVCSDIPALREVAADAAELVAPRDAAALARAIGAVLRDGDRRADLRRRGAARARRFVWERTAELTREAFARAIASRAERLSVG